MYSIENDSRPFSLYSVDLLEVEHWNRSEIMKRRRRGRERTPLPHRDDQSAVLRISHPPSCGHPLWYNTIRFEPPSTSTSSYKITTAYLFSDCNPSFHSLPWIYPQYNCHTRAKNHRSSVFKLALQPLPIPTRVLNLWKQKRPLPSLYLAQQQKWSW